MATVLSIIQDITSEFNSISSPSSITTSADNTVKQFKSIFEKEGKRLSRYCNWARLRKEHSFTLSDGEASYALPEDFDRFIPDTTWDRSNNRRLSGGLTPKQWQVQKSGISSTGIYRKFTVKGSADNKFFIEPTPGTSDNEDTIVFEYMTCNWLRPITWEASTSYAPAAYVSYNGNIYQTTAGGTSGSTAPTHTSGSSSDGGVTWTYYSDCYDKVLADTDVPLVDDDLLTLGTIWRFMRQNGLPFFEDVRAEYQSELRKRTSAYKNSPTINLAGKSTFLNRNFRDEIQGA